LEKVQQLPAEVQTDIARRVDSYIKMAEAAKEEGVVAMLASNAVWKSRQRLSAGGRYDGSALGRAGNCRGMVLCHA